MSVYVFIIMGPSGSGKTSLAEYLAQHYQCKFIEGDGLHPEANVAKMSSGVALTDDDRWHWLEDIRKSFVAQAQEFFRTSTSDRMIIVTCSALKLVYRKVLADVSNARILVKFIFLKVNEENLRQRLTERKGHYMSSSLLRSQLDTLEEPSHEENVLQIDADQEFDSVKQRAVHFINSFVC